MKKFNKQWKIPTPSPPLPIGPKTNEKIRIFYLIPIFLKATTSCIDLILLISMNTFFFNSKIKKKIGSNFSIFQS